MKYILSPYLSAYLNNRFTYHAPTTNQIEECATIRSVARSLAGDLCTLCPPSRERSLALTALEECVMWANASIARNPSGLAPGDTITEEKPLPPA